MTMALERYNFPPGYVWCGESLDPARWEPVLTDKEQALFDSIKEGMDEPGCGWLHELTPFNNDHVTAGVLGSLIEKGLVHSQEDEDGLSGYPPGYWITLAN